MGRDLKGLTICFVYSYFVFGPKLEDSEGPIGIIVRNLTKQTALHAKIAFARYRRPFSNEPEDLWQGQLSNDVLRLQGGDQVSILVRPLVDFVMVKKTGVHLEWDKVMKENMDNPDPHLYDLETNRDFSGGVDDTLDPHLYDLETNRDFAGGVDDTLDPHLYDLETNWDFLAVKPYLDFLGGTDDEARPSHDVSVPGDQVSAIDEESAVEDDPLGHGDLCTRLSLSVMENLDFSGGADDGAGRSHGAFVRTNQSSAVDKQLEWDKVMKENMDNPDPHLYDLETNRDFLSLSIMENLDFSGGADDGAGRSHGASNQPSAVDKQLKWDEVMKENMDPHLYDLETNRDFSGGVDVAFVPNQTSVILIHEQLAVEPYLDFFGGTDNEAGRSHDARPDDGAGRSHDAFVRTNQSSAVDEQLAMELMTPFQEIVPY